MQRTPVLLDAKQGFFYSLKGVQCTPFFAQKKLYLTPVP